ncbi:MAG: MoaD/ThiS family protein [Flammeovirgaceae bacterium]|nr:MoaD/ThiS family protein [Flammeovirgaceae bacterium]
MKLKIKTFGITRDILGGRLVEIEISQPTVSLLRSELTRRYPDLENLNSLFVAVNNKYADESEELSSTDEIALIPPVSGG